MGEDKIVLDTSVLIAGIIGSKASKDILIRVLNGELIAVISDSIFKEYLKAIQFDRVSDRIDFSRTYLILDKLYRVSLKATPKEKFKLSRDPGDDEFLNVAYEAKANYIITLDKDLLNLGNEAKKLKLKEHVIKILRPEEFLEELNKRA
ncbi:MAG: putative toxin-antitoxin system toxin component, PIN family [Thermoproteota archaeon]